MNSFKVEKMLDLIMVCTIFAINISSETETCVIYDWKKTLLFNKDSNDT